MARQKGLIRLQGTIGDINYYRSKDGYMARESNPISAQRIATDPRFARVRENMAEFSRAGKAGKLLRLAAKSLLTSVKDNRVAARLTGRMLQVVKADATSTRGQRNVIDGEAELLKGFDFNHSASMEDTLTAPFTATINRLTGVLTVDVPSFRPDEFLKAPSGATHFKMVSLGTEVDFTNNTYISDQQQSAILPCDTTPTPVLNMVNNVTPASTHPLFLLFGFQFYQEVSGVHYPLKAGAFNALKVVEVNGV
jgi:hypothetical protein